MWSVGPFTQPTDLGERLESRDLSLEAMRDARELGHRVAILQSSAMGCGVYRQLGFEQYSTYQVYEGTGQEE
jgi:predicted acetyltransferase